MKDFVNTIKFAVLAALTMGFALGATAGSGNDAEFKYLEPVYKTAGVPASGIDRWETNTLEYAYDMTDKHIVTSAVGAVTWGAAGVTNWYVVTNGEFQIDGNVTCAGHVNLVLCDGAKLTVTGTETNAAAIATDTSGSFTVYGSTVGNGHLVVTACNDDTDDNKPGCGAGIGGGRNAVGKNITINGGFIEATGGQRGPGIGSGGYAGAGDNNIVINGGLVKANCSGEHGAGIGGGTQGYVKGVVINGGTIIATGGKRSAGIGSGAQAKGASADITINGGYVVATGGNKDDTISAIGQGYAPNSKVSPTASGIRVSTAMKILADDNYPPTTEIANAGGDLTSAFAEKRYAIIRMPTEYTDDCLTFSSDGAFTLSATDQKWDGVLWTSTDKATWTVWNAATVAAAQTGGTGDYRLHLRGDIHNTKINDPFSGYYWKLTPAGDNKIACTGNIETLRGATGDAPSPTPMAPFCYANLFRYCASLTSAPTLPATNLSMRCYGSLFVNCTSLTEAPALPAVNLYDWCYEGMFFGCSSLTSAPPVLPAMDLAMECYQHMFYGCTSLPAAPALPATNLAVRCYCDMFTDCTSLTSAPPVLAAMTLTDRCYASMFMRCTSLPAAPALPATTLATACYQNMFYECTSLAAAPVLPATNMEHSCYDGMFHGCTSLTDIPALPAKVLKQDCYQLMFCACSNLVINTTGPGRPWSLPAEAEASTNDAPKWGGYPGGYMFTDTGGDVPELPVFGQTYYIASVSAEWSLVRPQTIEHATFELYTNGCAVVGGECTAPSGTLVRVVYKADDGYCFMGGTMATAEYVAWQAVAQVPAEQLPGETLKIADCVTFSSDGAFTLGVEYPPWEGTLWTSTNKTTWAVWNGATVAAAQEGGVGDYRLYVRGDVRNTKISTEYLNQRWTLTPAGENKIALSGNIETLRGATGDAPSPTPMGVSCYRHMFDGAASLSAAPALPATNLAERCYDHMFHDCASLTNAPALPAADLAEFCYANMFQNCTSLPAAPTLSATNLAESCYSGMFFGCTALTSVQPVLPVMDLTKHCYGNMFLDCTSLKAAPALPATNLTSYCYQGMFWGCTSLTNAPVLLATKLADSCYSSMFADCVALTTAPALPATDLTNSCYSSMFLGCTSLTTVPALPATNLAKSCYQAMFQNCTSLLDVPDLPATVLKDGCYAGMFCGCSNLVINTTESAKEWSIPAAAEASTNDAPNWAVYEKTYLGESYYMLAGTGGDAPDEPVIGRTYYIGSAIATVTPQTVAHTTSKVYTNDTVEVVSPCKVPWGTTVKVVYTVDAGYVFADGTTEKSATFTAESNPASVPEAQLPAAPIKVEVEYRTPVYNGEDGNPTNGIAYWDSGLHDCSVVTSAMGAVEWGSAGTTTWYAVESDVTIAGRITCVGDVRLILENGATLNAEAGITASTGTPETPIDYLGFTVYAQSADSSVMGALVATSSIHRASAAIGGATVGEEDEAPGVNITINGGKVLVRGSTTTDDGAAGIGGTVSGNGVRLTINGGIVTALGGDGAAGIGGGSGGGGSDITVNGGTVTAIGLYGAGIGGGMRAAGSNITINAGTIFVGGVVARVEGEEPGEDEYYYPDIIGRGAGSEDPASGIVIAPAAKVFFNLTGIKDYQNEDGTWAEVMSPMPDSFDDFVIMTPNVPVGRVLAGGYIKSSLPAFALTNAVTGATGEVEIDGVTVLFEDRVLSLPIVDGNLTLKVDETSPIFAEPIPVEHATFEVYTNGVLSTETSTGSGVWYAWSNQTSKIVYTAVGEYYFEGGMKSVTNELNTAVNPAVNKTAAPSVLEPIDYPKPTYVEGAASKGIANWTTNTCYNYTIVTSATDAVTWGAEGETNWVVVMNADTWIDGGVVCHGYINLILCEGAKLVVTNVADGCAGISTDTNGAFTVYGQPDGAGELYAYAKDTGAGIGGDDVNGGGVAITINGGTVTAVSLKNGAGIGGSTSYNGEDIVINGGTVRASCGTEGAGIGGGQRGAGKRISINGGTVVAICHSDGGAGIGGGAARDGSDIVINGGDVTAVAGAGGAAIGGGAQNGRGYDIAINDGIVRLAAPIMTTAEYANLMMCGSYIGNAAEFGSTGGPASNITISSTAKLLFNLTGVGNEYDVMVEPVSPMPTDFVNGTIMTPGTQCVDRILVGGLSSLTAPSLFPTLFFTNTLTGATLEANLGETNTFACMFCCVKSADDHLLLNLFPPELTITQQPSSGNQYEIRAETNGDDGILKYSWYKLDEGTVDYNTLTNTMNKSDVNGTFDGTDIHSIDFEAQGVDEFVGISWDPGILPDGGVFCFTCTNELGDAVDKMGYGQSCVLTRNGDDWELAPVANVALSGMVALWVYNKDDESVPFTLEDVRYVVRSDTLVDEGAEMTALPLDDAEVGSNYLCRVTYGHAGILYTGDSDVFTYILPEPILAQPTPVEHATLVVYTNGFISTEVEPGKWAAWSNRTATVVYTAEGDYYFDGGLKAVTNELDTTKNPAVNKGDLPAVLDPIKYLAPVYVDNIASNGIAYWTTNTCYSYTVVTGAENEVMWGAEEATSWYVVKDGDYQVDGRVVCLGHINLILCEGAKLVVTNAPSDSAGIETYEDGSFTIYGQPNGAGTLETMGGDGGAALGGSYNRVGSCITINGGTVLAVGGYNGAGVGGGRSGEGRFITINGGTVMATGGSEAPGIGSGAYRDTTDITINGGIVTAYGRNGSAGIGSSWYSDASHIVINGGTVTAYGSEGAAGVGGGYFGEGRDIAINGGTVTAVGGCHAAGIGGGECRNGFDISINGGAVTAISGNRSAAIGGGYAAGGYDITISNAVVFVCAVPEDYYGEIIVSDVIGNGCECEDPASGIVIDSSAKVLFNLTGLWDGRDNVWSQPMTEMPADFEGFTIMTPGKQSVDRVLVNGLSASAFQSSIFNLTNATSGSTGTIEVDGASEVAFAGMFCSLTNDSGKLTLKVRPPMVDITQQPHMTNGYVIAATTDAEDGFVNYAWYRSGGAKVYDFLSAWDANEDAQVYFHGERHGTTLFSTWDDDYGCHCIELAWNVEELGLPTNGVLRFTCSDDFSYPDPIGTFTRDGDEWTFTPNDVRSYVETSFCTYDLCLYIDAPISNLRWVIPNGDSYESVETLIAEGASMTTFPVGQGEEGSNYFCRITYAHVGAQYTTDSEEFAYAAPSVFAIDSHTLTVGTEPTAGGTIAVTNEAAVGSDVAVKAYPGLYWQFNYWEGSNVVNGTSLTFVNKFAADTMFEMPAADVDVTAIFALSEPYRAERLNALAVAALDAAMQVRTTLTLSPAEMDAIFAKIIAANDVAESAIRAAYTPTQVQDAEAAANAVFAAAVNEAEDTAEAKVRFEASELSVTEGTSSFALVVYGGSTNRSTAVNVSFVKNTYTKKPKAYMIVDGVEKKVKFPITLDWAKGDRLPKKIRLEFKSNKKAEVDKYFTLQLGSEVACAVGPIGICRVTVKDQTEVSGSDYPYVRALAWPVNGGKANGSGYVKKATATRTLRAKAKKWAKFDGWYRASTNAPNDFAQAEFVTSEAKFKVAQGDAGTYFAHYVDVTPVIAVNDPDFTAEGVQGVTANDEGIATCKVGEPVSFPMTYTADPDSKPKLSVKKLPKGLKYDRKTGLVSGTPKKSGSFTAQAKGRNTPGKHTLKIKFEVQ